MRKHAQALRRAGRFGDRHLVHVNDRELGYLASIWGEPSTNPTTGLPEFFDFGGILSWLAPAIVSGGAEALGGAGTLGSIGSLFGAGADWAPTVGGSLLGALTGGLTQGLQGKDALMGALGGGLLGGAVPSAGSALGFKEFQTPFNIPTLFDLAGGLGVAAPAAVSSAATDIGAFPGAAASAAGAATTGGDVDPSGINRLATGAGLPSSSGGIAGWLGKNPMAPLLALGALSALSTSPTKAQPPPPAQPTRSTYTFPTTPLQRTRRKNSNEPMPAGEYNFYNDNYIPSGFAEGGDVMGGPPDGGAEGYIQGPGDGRADMIPARLSNDEYVMTAEDMALLGNGSPSAGADKMDQFRVNLRKHKGKALARGHFSPDAKPVEGYL